MAKRTRRSSAQGTSPLPGADPGVVSINVTNSTSATDIPVNVPWNGCRLAAVYGVVTTLVDTAAAMELKFELDAASGTEIMVMTVAAASAVGTEDTATFSTESGGRNLDSSNQINIEVDGSSDGTGAVELFLYFEPDIA